MNIRIIIIAILCIVNLTNCYCDNCQEKDNIRYITGFLECIKSDSNNGLSVSEDGSFNSRNGGNFDVERIMGYIPEGGIDFININSRKIIKNNYEEIKSNLQRKNGDIYLHLIHLGYIYSKKNKNQISFQESKDSIILNVDNWYKITFKKMNKKYYLKKIEYLVIEGD